MRARAYVDGLNLYHGMRDAGLLRYRWLDIEQLCKHLVADAGTRLGSMSLEQVLYCTSLVVRSRSRRRQDLYLQGLQSNCTLLRLQQGRYEEKTRSCTCGRDVSFQKEKRTDVNLAVNMVADAHLPADERPDVQILVTGDTDLVPAIELVRSTGTGVVVVTPPARHQNHLASVADVYLRIGRRQLKYSPLPGVIVRQDTGYEITPPPTWDHPDTW